MTFYDAFAGTERPRARPLYDPGLGGYSYRDVYADQAPEESFSSRVSTRIKAMQQLTQAQRVAQSNPEAEAARRVQEEHGQKRKGLGKLMGIPELPGIRHALGAVQALGQANLVAGQAGRERLHDQEIIEQDAAGNEVGRRTRKGSALGAFSEIVKGYGRGLTGGEHTSFVDATGGKLAGMALPERGAGRIATEILGGTLTDPLSFMGAGTAGTAFRTAKGAAKAAGGAGLAAKLGREGLKGLDEAEQLLITTQLARNAELAPTRFARGTAAERAARTATKAGRYGKEGLHVNVPFLPGAGGQFSLGGTKFAETAAGIDKATGIGSKLSALRNTESAVKLRGITNPRAQIAAEKGEDYAKDVRDAERRASALRQDLGRDATSVTRDIMQRGNFTPDDITYVRRALDEGTDVVQMADRARTPELKQLIHHLHDTVRRGDQMLVNMGVNPEHLLSAGNYVPRQLTKEGRKALSAIDNDRLQRLFGVDANEIQSLRQEIERGTVVKRRVFKGPLDQAEKQIGAITGAKVKHFEDDPVKAILDHYGNIAGSYSQRQMLREMAKGGLIEKAGKGSAIDAGAMGGSYAGPQTLADYLNRRAKPLYQDPSQEALKGVAGKAQSAWKAGALNWPGTAARDIFGNAWRQMIEGIGTRQFREARQGHKGLKWATENPAEVEGAWIDETRRALEPGPRPFGELLERNPTPPELPASRFPALGPAGSTGQPVPPGAPPVNVLDPSGQLRFMGGGQPPLALPAGRGPVRPTDPDRLRSLRERALEAHRRGEKVHNPYEIDRLFDQLPSGTPNSIQEVDPIQELIDLGMPPEMIEEAKRMFAAQPQRRARMFDTEGRPVADTTSELTSRGRVKDVHAWTANDYQGQGLAAGEGGLWETMLRMGIPLTDEGKGGLSHAGAGAASGIRARLGIPDDVGGVLEEGTKVIPGQGVPIPMGPNGPMPLELGPGPRVRAPWEDLPGGPGAQPQLTTGTGGRLHGFRSPAPIQGPPGPAEILAGQGKVPFALGAGATPDQQLAMSLDLLKGRGPVWPPTGPRALPTGPPAPRALGPGPAAPAAVQGPQGPFAMGPPPPAAIPETTGGTPLARWLEGEGYTRPGTPQAVPSGPGFAVPGGGPGGPLDAAALDRLKGLPGAPRVGESRVTQRLRQVASGGFEGSPLSADEARFLMMAREQGAMLPGFTASMGGAAGAQRTKGGRAWGKRNTALRDVLGVEPFEERARLSLFHKLIAEGMDPNSAAGEVEDAFFNYADVSQSVQGARKVAPFIGFRVKNVQRTLRDLGRAPGRVTHPARIQTSAMEEKDATDAARGEFIQQLVSEGVDPEEANQQAEEKFGKPGLSSVMAQGGIPIPGTDAYAKLSITSDAALEDLYLAPRIAAAVGGAKADKNLAGDLLSQAGGPLPGLAKAIAETNAGEYMYSGGKIKPGFFNNPFVSNLAPQPGRINQLLGPKPLGSKLSSAIAGLPTYQGGDPRNLQSEVYRREESSAANDVMDDLTDELRKAENAGLDDQAAAIQAVMEWVKANPEYVDTSQGAASRDPANADPMAMMKAMRSKSMIEKILASTRAQYAPPVRTR